jgi:predicted NAD/FAD-dependent oxidoreductase
VDAPADVVAKALLAAFGEALGGTLPALREIAAHRWLYARTRQALGEPCLHDPALRIGVCGDWCLGANVESAWRSGAALAQRMLAGRS